MGALFFKSKTDFLRFAKRGLWPDTGSSEIGEQ
ncbi:MAG: hypothetical protein ACJAYR_000003 [Sneathiella sp.]|jgi:hypothetical protein